MNGVVRAQPVALGRLCRRLDQRPIDLRDTQCLPAGFQLAPHGVPARVSDAPSAPRSCERSSHLEVREPRSSHLNCIAAKALDLLPAILGEQELYERRRFEVEVQ
jgi:hypothetical protein